MSTYFRYLRPVQFDFERGALNVMSRGGVCFQINDDIPTKKLFSYSICHNDDAFSKTVARAISNERMNLLVQQKSSKLITHLFEIGTFNPLSRHENEIIAAVEKFISISEDIDVVNEECFFFEDLLLLQEKINDINVTHDVAYAMLKEWQNNDINDALRIFYKNKL